MDLRARRNLSVRGTSAPSHEASHESYWLQYGNFNKACRQVTCYHDVAVAVHRPDVTQLAAKTHILPRLLQTHLT